ncbi:hypothetical protein L915_17809 [Phytophthora nicotianae]|uniref:Uncharacterized protein n=1 Tax=Phytophthora nicotianae TaxID=4792 RepID=W2I4K6_PHYNI|nr:hypothetical protein L915_17809 [Phytophthora nicotianae]ETL29065.1 hypothetical protein L916_17708 [Phytophthora nicotianae]
MSETVGPASAASVMLGSAADARHLSLPSWWTRPTTHYLYMAGMTANTKRGHGSQSSGWTWEQREGLSS